MSAKVAIIDYGVGNLLSVARAVEAAGGRACLVSDASALPDFDRVILPGVGAFAHCMASLRNNNFLEAVTKFIGSGRPFLGICVGMQMLMNSSTEFGLHGGLGVIQGAVDAVPAHGADGTKHKIPHIGWAALAQPPEGDWNGTVLNGVPVGTYVYFVHSYTAYPASLQHRLADAYYDGCQIAAVVGRDNVIGCQFHPEKSGKAGLAILRNFIAGHTA